MGKMSKRREKASKKQVMAVLLAYSLGWCLFLGFPLIAVMTKWMPYRYDIAVVCYCLVPVIFCLRAFVLGGGLHFRLTLAVNDAYGDELAGMNRRLIDLGCLCLVRMGSVWLMFPGQWFQKLLTEKEGFVVYEETLDRWLASLETAQGARKR